MRVRASATTKSFILGAASLTIAVSSVLLAQQVNYLSHLTLFNSTALLMLSFAIAALLLSIVGIWRQQENNL
jgi:hypothetical protein